MYFLKRNYGENYIRSSVTLKSSPFFIGYSHEVAEIGFNNRSSHCFQILEGMDNFSKKETLGNKISFCKIILL